MISMSQAMPSQCASRTKAARPSKTGSNASVKIKTKNRVILALSLPLTYLINNALIIKAMIDKIDGPSFACLTTLICLALE